MPAVDSALTELGDCHQETHGDDSSSLGRQEATKKPSSSTIGLQFMENGTSEYIYLFGPLLKKKLFT